MAPPIHVWLVHGTFEPDPLWTDPERSPLCHAVQRAVGDTVRFHRHRWSAKNRHADRVNGGNDLRREVLEVRGVHPDAVLAVIGHSHGGTVIAHALRGSPELGRALNGLAFLSTPFIQLVPRVHAVAIGAIAALFGLMLFASLATAFDERGLMTTLGLAPGTQEIIRWLVMVAIGIGVVVWERVLGAPDVEKWLRARLTAIQQEFQVEHLDPAKTLLIRAQADEASLSLTSVHALSRLLGEIVGRLAVVLIWFVPVLADRRAATRVRQGTDWLALPLGAVFVAAIGFVVLIMLGDAVAWMSKVLGVSPGDVGPWAVALRERWHTASAWFDARRPAVMAAFFGLGLAGTTLMLLLAAAFGVMGRAFGRWFFLPGLFLEMFVEPTPPGRWTMVQLSAPDQADLFVSGGEVQLTHSLSHSDPTAHMALADWLSRLVRQLDASAGIDPRSRNT